jgi:hypothetical protein
MMPTFPRSSLSFRTAGFPSTAGRQAFQTVPSQIVDDLSLLPACAVRRLVCIRLSCTLVVTTVCPALCRAAASVVHLERRDPRDFRITIRTPSDKTPGDAGHIEEGRFLEFSDGSVEVKDSRGRPVCVA